MQIRSPSHCAAVLVLAAPALIMSPDAAIAQESETIEEVVVVVAPFAIERTKTERTSPTMDTELVELKRRVGFADLDLSKHDDVIEFETRIESTATESCEILAEMFPFDTSDREIRRCSREAIASAEDQKGQAIAAAN